MGPWDAEGHLSDLRVADNLPDLLGRDVLQRVPPDLHIFKLDLPLQQAHLDLSKVRRNELSQRRLNDVADQLGRHEPSPGGASP